MKKIIVTGGLGFIGSNLIKLLIKKKYYVVNVDKINYASNFYNTKDFSNKKNARLRWDLCFCRKKKRSDFIRFING